MNSEYMIKCMTRSVWWLAIGLCIPLAAYAQEEEKSTETPPTGQIVDKIIAKVDNYIILESDLQKTYLEALARAQQGFETPTRCDVFESMLVNKMMRSEERRVGKECRYRWERYM